MSPWVPTPPTTTLEPRLGRHLCGGMQIFVKTKNSQDQMRIGRQQSSPRSSPKKPTRPPARSLPGTPARRGKTLAGPPGKTLAEPPGKTVAKCTGKATARPTPAKLQPPFIRSHQPNQLGRHLRGSMQTFVEAPPPCHLSCLPAYMAPHAPLAGARVQARMSGDELDGPCSRSR